MAKVLVTIKNSGTIPLVGIGPFLKPIAIEEAQYLSLKAQGYAISLAAGPVLTEVVEAPKEEAKAPVEAPKEEEPKAPEAPAETPKEEEPTPEAPKVETPEAPAKVAAPEFDTTTVKQLKVMLTEMEVPFDPKSTKQELHDLLVKALA